MDITTKIFLHLERIVGIWLHRIAWIERITRIDRIDRIHRG